MLVVVSGLPGTGKSTVASALAERVGATHLSVDPIEDAMVAAGLPRGVATGVAAYEVAAAVARQNLRLGAAVVVDAVNDSEPARRTWRLAAADTACSPVFVLLMLDDRQEHRRRVEHREWDQQHLGRPSWADVLARAQAFEPWAEGDRLSVDAHRPVAELVRELAARLFDR